MQALENLWYARGYSNFNVQLAARTSCLSSMASCYASSPGRCERRPALGNPEWGRNLAAELEDAGCRWSSRRSHPGCDERRGLRRSVGDDELQGERYPSEFQAGLHA
jgi:hypothetical protein